MAESRRRGGTTSRPSPRTSDSGNSRDSSRGGLSWRSGCRPRADQLGEAARDLGRRPCPCGAASCGVRAGRRRGRPRAGRRGTACGRRSPRPSRLGSMSCSPSGPAKTSSRAWSRSSAVEYCIETRCVIWWLRLSRINRPPRGVRRVQQRRHEPVAVVEVGLPVEGVVLVGPRHVPDRGAGEGHRRVAGALGAQAELGVVPLDEERQREPDLLEDLARDQAHEPAVEVDVDPAVQPAASSAGCGRRSPSRRTSRARAPPEPPRLDDLAEGVQPRAAVDAEHVAADDGRAAARGRRR